MSLDGVGTYPCPPEQRRIWLAGQVGGDRVVLRDLDGMSDEAVAALLGGEG